MTIQLIDYVGDAKVEDGSVFNNMLVRVVGKDVLFDFAGMNPSEAKNLDPDNQMGIKDNEILLNKDTDSVDKDTANHELNEDRELRADSNLTYWEVHTTLQKLANKPDYNMSLDNMEAKTMPIPKPKPEEKESDFISRCISAISGEYDKDQAAAICYSQFREKALPGLVRKSVPLTKGENGCIVISTGTPDRSGDRVFPEGGDFTNYRKNPVVMWLHDYKGTTPSAGIPIGKNTSIKVVDKKIEVSEPIFLDGDAFAERVKNAWDKDFIRTVSIGFAPLEDPTPNDFGGMDYKKWELLEWSIVPIPMNAEAIRVAKDFPDLVERKHSQGEIRDELDYTLSLIKEWDLNPDNEKIVKTIHGELNKRYPGGDMPVNKYLTNTHKALIVEAIELCNQAETLCNDHHKAHNVVHKDLVLGITECRARLKGLTPEELEQEGKPEEKPEETGNKLLESLFTK